MVDLPKTDQETFVAAWVRSIPTRWARNGLILALLFCFGQFGGGGSEQLRALLDAILANPRVLIMLISGVATMVFLLPLIAWILGLLARFSLRRHLANPRLPRRITINWLLGGVLVYLSILVLDVVLQWRGPVLVEGGGLNATVQNVAYVVGGMVSALIIAFFVSLFSRRGLRKARTIDDTIMAAYNAP